MGLLLKYLEQKCTGVNGRSKCKLWAIRENPPTRPSAMQPFSTKGTKMAGDIHVVPLSPQAVALL